MNRKCKSAILHAGNVTNLITLSNRTESGYGVRLLFGAGDWVGAGDGVGSPLPDGEAEVEAVGDEDDGGKGEGDGVARMSSHANSSPL